MKGFFKFTLASILGVILGIIILVFIGLGIGSAISAEKPVELEDNTILVAKFEGPIMDRKPESPFGFNPASFGEPAVLGLDEILKNIEKAKDDDNIDGIFLDLSVIPAGAATLEEIRNALIDFKTSEKFIIAWSDDFISQGTYYLATVADKVYLAPQGNLLLLGLKSEVIFFKKALDKLGIEFQVLKYGEYKGATEPLLYEKLSKENREQIQQYLNSMWGNISENISEARGIPVDELNRYADELLITNADDALEYKLVDGLKYYDEILDELKELTNTDEDDDLEAVSMAKYTKAPKEKKHKGLAKNKIAVIYATGNIQDGEGDDGAIGSDVFAKAIRKARKDSTIKAIVLRINSGGGSGLASDIIWREVKLAAETKPLMVSMGNAAASGGYYIAAPADKIFAGPMTITGSIGVFGIFPNMQKLFNDKLGITTDPVVTNKHSNFPTVFEPLGEFERITLQKEVDNFYDGFVEIVAEGRGMTTEEVDKIARGHVYTGLDALELGLVDEIGGLNAAIAAAVEAADVEEYRIVKLPKVEDPFEKLLKSMKGEARMKFAKKTLGENYFYLEKIEEIKDIEGVQARLPYIIKTDF